MYQSLHSIIPYNYSIDLKKTIWTLHLERILLSFLQAFHLCCILLHCCIH